MMSNWWDDWWGDVKEGFEGGKKAGEDVGDKINEFTGMPDSSGAISALSDPLSFVKAVWLNVSDYRMWRSLGWLILGIVIMGAGIALWSKKAIASTVLPV